jgi:hypothetical protein
MKSRRGVKRKHTNRLATWTALARRLGVSRQLLASRRKIPGAPALNDVAGWQTFLAAFGREGSAPPELRAKIAEQRLALLAEMTKRARLENMRTESRTVERGAVQLCLARGVGLLFSELDRFATIEGPTALRGLDEQGCCAVLQVEMKRIGENFRAGLQELAIDPGGPTKADRTTVDESDHPRLRALFDRRVDAERRWRSATDPKERERIWHTELQPLLRGELPATSATPLNSPAPEEPS